MTHQTNPGQEAEPVTRTRGPVVAAATTGLMALAACAQHDGTPVSDLGTRLAVAERGQLGPVVTDQDGHTLYRSDRDRADPSAATCVDACARLWLPMIVSDAGAVGLTGVSKTLVGTVRRTDGGNQLTLNGWPLYHFAEDVRP
ncbi:MAG TPA: hypothetical protein VFO68_22895, partial [Actinophytocola sp.]|nr:hypothetical protein [Actinophytocola sp.]